MNKSKSNELMWVPDIYTDNSLKEYIKQIGQVERLSAEEEHELVKLKEGGDIEAARKLILANLPYVVYVAKKYSGYKLPMADLIQEGNIGLMKAIKKFSSEHGVRVSTYAVHWIKSEMNEYVIKNVKIVRPATTKPQRKLFFKLKSSKSHLGYFTSDEIESVAKKLNVKPSDVLEMEKRLGHTDVPFDAPAHQTTATREIDIKEFAPVDVIDSGVNNPLEQAEIDATENHQRDMLHSSLKSLTERERDIIQQRWLNDAEEEHRPTLHDLAAEYDVSAERIRQIERAAMNKMGKWLTN